MCRRINFNFASCSCDTLKFGSQNLRRCILRNSFQFHASTLLRQDFAPSYKLRPKSANNCAPASRGRRRPVAKEIIVGSTQFTISQLLELPPKQKQSAPAPSHSPPLRWLSEKDVENPGICQKVSDRRRGIGKSWGREFSPARVTSKHSLQRQQVSSVCLPLPL